jgi:exopolyphosphatase/guanosine-5'-triphosphate,3'-diphosphate pyrophosphatase
MRLAAIDIGTNSLHMIVCRVRPDLSFEVIDREKDMVRLGAGGLDGRRLADANMAAAIHTLSKFTRLAASHGVDEVIAAATSAVREADNGADFVGAIQRDLGLHVRVISGTEEARLIHLAAAYAIHIGRRAAIVIDIGGGSTEITIGTGDRPSAGRSFPLGAIRLTERFVSRDPLASDDEARLVRHIRRHTAAHLRQLARRRVDRIIGTSGTILSLGALAAGARPGDDLRGRRVSAKALRRVRKRLTSLSLERRLKWPGLDPRRADLAPVGAVLLDTLLDGLGAEEITLCDFALREGLVLEYIQRHGADIRRIDRYPDVRRRSVVELAERCHYFPVHAEQVARLSLAIFDATRDQHGLGATAREWLEYGALLHDIGSHIGYEGHHKHSSYLIRHGGLRGFELDDIETIALVARYHRQATPRRAHGPFGALPKPRRRAVKILSAIVRLAEGLDRSHAQVVAGLRVRATGGTLRVTLSAAGDAGLELWAAARHAAPLSAALGLPIHFDLSGPRDTPAARTHRTTHARHARHSAHLPRPAVRRRRH